ncbi:Rap1a/Tai family immunity protein [Massilia sp. MP_M2]|uniref:Rap1a/Tai family immunity protein n=1 Tax=Massilia sp. MP_M2 TaxID=3071713 RepID=UPI00319E40F0
MAKVIGQPGVDKWRQQPDAAFQQRYAEGYQAGVVDATQGRLWCAPPGMKPLEIDDRIWDELRGRAGSMPGNAAAELIALYVARFPCADGR